METSDDALAGLTRALAACGGTTALTRALGLSKSVVGQWRQAGGIPVARVPAVARITGLPPAVLRPDLFSRAAPAGFAEAQAPFMAEAGALGLDADAIAAKAVREAVGWERARRWAAENHAAIDAWNAHFAENDTPLAEYRQF